ncbi:MAG: hypothetical protein ACKOPO_14995, partial [Novosphingobium sp.]
ADKPGPVTLNPDKAYVMVVSATGFAMPTFMRLPNAEEAAKYAAERAEELAKEHAKWVKKFDSWEKQMESMKKMPSTVKRPARPQEPTEENFSFPQYEQVHSFLVGPQNRFSKVKESVWLQEVPPGEYLFYGSGTLCACLGTASFSAPAGKVVALEFGLPFFEAWREAPKDQRPKTPFDLPKGTSSLRLGASTFTDSRLPEGSVIAPDFKPAGTRPNWFGQEIDRLNPIPGVFEYQRDRQVDLKAKPAA